MKKNKTDLRAEKVLQKIIARRQELGVSQMDLAAKINITNNGYFKVETGKTKLDLKRLLRIAEVLEVSPVVFFEGL